MPRVAGRTREDTRRALLDAAGVCIRARGAAATLDHIAKQAGVSKGGLLHHFATKDDLVRALAQDLFDRFRADVTAAVDHGDLAPGRLTRAYIRVSAALSRDPDTFHDLGPLIGHLAAIPEITDLAHADTRRWRDDLADDGLPPHITALVTAAADGISIIPTWNHTDPEPHHDLEALLLHLTTNTTAWSHLALP
ncbi:TetR/AcrR family transcriptional regulator [Umezawaea tangerina]|uniref:TetR family transcriptional regulator n=1 Tax=Umezawaea tangerina TaxID=84725 RepID=A0A2T0T041_9PSEU|nr:TetR/AcrR family transcriptional regulator [Umezawaea tangerina]PRY38983.1 TetR family transcriptional regulator [Umezawaea tangerina]